MTGSVPSHSPTEQLEVDAELQRLAKLLDLTVPELEYLAELPADELRALRRQMTASLYDGHPAISRIGASTRVVPAGLTASLAEKVFGPMLAARIAGGIEPDRAVDIASRLSTPFLADVAVELDPRHVGTILSRISPDTVAEVTSLLCERDEWVAMGNFLPYLPPEATRAAMARTDARALLHIALVLEDKRRLSAWLEVADDATLTAVPEVAESEGLSAQLEALSSHLTPQQQARLQG